MKGIDSLINLETKLNVGLPKETMKADLNDIKADLEVLEILYKFMKRDMILGTPKLVELARNETEDFNKMLAWYSERRKADVKGEGK